MTKYGLIFWKIIHPLKFEDFYQIFKDAKAMLNEKIHLVCLS